MRIALILLGCVLLGAVVLYALGIGILVNSRSVYPERDTNPWDTALLESRDNTPTLRCYYFSGVSVVERYFPAGRPDGSGEAICPRVLNLN